jgi:hypothetical protein
MNLGSMSLIGFPRITLMPKSFIYNPKLYPRADIVGNTPWMLNKLQNLNLSPSNQIQLTQYNKKITN